MSLAKSSVWYRHPGSSFYILANSVPSARLFVKPSYYKQSSHSNSPLQRATTEEVEDVEEGDDEELNQGFIHVGSKDSGMGTVDELKSYEGEEASGNGDLDAIEYSPISISLWLSYGMKELIALNLGPLGGEIEGDIDADERSEVAVGVGAVVGDVMEDEHPVDFRLEVKQKIGKAPGLMDYERDSNVKRIQVSPAVRRSSRLLKKSKDEAHLDESPKKKVIRWMTRNRCDCCNEFSKK